MHRDSITGPKRHFVALSFKGFGFLTWNGRKEERELEISIQLIREMEGNILQISCDKTVLNEIGSKSRGVDE